MTMQVESFLGNERLIPEEHEQNPDMEVVTTGLIFYTSDEDEEASDEPLPVQSQPLNKNVGGEDEVVEGDFQELDDSVNVAEPDSLQVEFPRVEFVGNVDVRVVNGDLYPDEVLHTEEDDLESVVYVDTDEEVWEGLARKRGEVDDNDETSISKRARILD
jgi:hypothetical protein